MGSKNSQCRQIAGVEEVAEAGFVEHGHAEHRDPNGDIGDPVTSRDGEPGNDKPQRRSAVGEQRPLVRKRRTRIDIRAIVWPPLGSPHSTILPRSESVWATTDFFRQFGYKCWVQVSA